MSGNVKVRKQWQLQGADGPRGTLRRLRSQMAEDGCVDSQVIVAKHLLEEAKLEGEDGDGDKRAVEAVYWLTRAAEHAKEEATVMLRECFTTGLGITKRNYDDVKACLEMDSEERLFRAAARDVFLRLSALEDDYITTNQLKVWVQTKLNNAGKSESENSMDDSDYTDAHVFEFGGQKLSEEELVSIAGEAYRGNLPELCLADGDEFGRRTEKTSSRNVAQWLMSYLSASHFKFLEIICKHGDKVVHLIFPYNQLQTLGYIMLCSVLTIDFFLAALPLVVFYFAFIIQVISTVQLVHSARTFTTFKWWLTLFKAAHHNVNEDKATLNFCHKCLWIYLKFFCALLVVVGTFPHCNLLFVPLSGLTSLSLVLTFLVLLSLNKSWGCVEVSFVILNVLSVIPQWKLDLESMLTLNGNTMILVKMLSPVLDTSMRDIPLTSILLPLLIFFMMKKYNWRGIYFTALPSIVAQCWFHLTFLLNADISLKPLFLPILLWSSLFISPVLFAVLILPLIVSRFSKSVFTSDVFLTVLFISGNICMTSLFNWISIRWVSSISKWKKVVLAFQIAIGILAMLHFLPMLKEAGDQMLGAPRPSDLDWDTYLNFCHEPAWEKATVVNVQRLCSHLIGTSISWEGKVLHVEIARVHNSLENVLGMLSPKFSDALRCALGTRYSKCEEEEGFEYERCAMLAANAPHTCHTKSWDRYHFEVVIQMRSGYWNSAEVVLAAEHGFTDFVMNLHPEDVVRYEGTFLSGVGGSRPHISLLAISCKVCSVQLQPITPVQSISLQQKWFATVSALLTFFVPYAIELGRNATIT